MLRGKPSLTSRPTRAGAFRRAETGGEAYEIFHPNPLPPDPPLDLSTLQDLADRANQALGRLDGITLLLPNPEQFLYSYVRKEAVLSAQIEGTQSSLSELLLFEHEDSPGVPRVEVAEPLNYVRALYHALERIENGFPLSNRLLREAHALLLDDTRGRDKAPGEFRTTQNWIGGTRPGTARFVPPPPREVPPAMSDLEKFLHDRPTRTPILFKAALAHAQFETIHPFLDGNGRLGRLLVALLLCGEGQVLSKPLLYLSLYLKRNRDEYYERLQRVRTHGEWEEWARFFLAGVVEVAESAAETTRRLLALVERDRERIQTLGRAAATSARLHDIAVSEIVFRIPDSARRLDTSEVTIGNAARNLEALGIVRESTGRRQNKRFVYADYLAIIEEGTGE
ncbi:MAG: Fic family protein [Actinomycetota bacterium]|nr:Fic family protein [Actinomycetota bacterium]